MTIQSGRIYYITDASKQRPVLLVVQNNGAGGTPNIFIGDDQTSLQQSGLLIPAGAASPQITITSPYYVIADSVGGSSQDVKWNVNRLVQ